MNKNKWSGIIAEILATMVMVAGTAVIIAGAAKIIIWMFG